MALWAGVQGHHAYTHNHIARTHSNTEFLAFVRLVMTLARPVWFIGKPWGSIDKPEEALPTAMSVNSALQLTACLRGLMAESLVALDPIDYVLGLAACIVCYFLNTFDVQIHRSSKQVQIQKRKYTKLTRFFPTCGWKQVTVSDYDF